MPNVVVNCSVLGVDDDGLKVLLIERTLEPFRGHWSLPGGYIRANESLETTLLRELEEDTGLKNVWIEQVQTFGDPARDTRFRVVCIHFLGLVNLRDPHTMAATTAREADWFPLRLVPPLAFDHSELLSAALRHVRLKTFSQPIGMEMLPLAFPLEHLQKLYEQLWNRPLDPQAFRREILARGVLCPVVSQNGTEEFSFDRHVYREAMKDGYQLHLSFTR
jgi:8-oxo-dGTP diphosphatase